MDIPLPFLPYVVTRKFFMGKEVSFRNNSTIIAIYIYLESFRRKYK
jgi:hypothetical protein